ncbi:MAG: VanW family protein [Acidimicrobiia bacterium]|nr:VanW family protein [Acidimicrobiia bacterium]
MTTDPPPKHTVRAPLAPLDPPGRAALGQMWQFQRAALLMLLGATVLLVLVGVTVAERIAYREHVLPGVTVAGTQIAGDTEPAALHEIEDLADRLRRQPIHAHAGTLALTLDPATIDYHVDAAATVRAARRAGRASNPVDAISGTVLRHLRTDNVPLVVRYNERQLAETIDLWVGATGKGLVDGGLRFDGTQVAEIRPRRGVGINRGEAERRILAALRSGRTDIGELRIGTTNPTIDATEVRRAARNARRVLRTPVKIHVGDTTMTLSRAQLASTLKTRITGTRLHLEVDEAALRVNLEPTLQLVETQPQDAGFAINGTTVSVVPAVTGQTVELGPLGRAIAAGRHLITARLAPTEPVRTTKWAEDLHITELVASYTTNHPCCQPRVTNIHNGAQVIDGTILQPGETFSLNEALGARTLEKGYLSAPGIGANLEFEDSVGGGVSQLSTTLYNASFFGCYQDITHTVHALYISRYPMGREATLNYPSIDNKFRNDTQSGVLIRTYFSNTSITVALYGSKEGRTCKADGPHILQTIPVVPEYIDDPTLPVGTERQISSGSTGYVVENFRVISRPGQPDKRERYVENYAMAKAKIARGTGPATPTTVPAAPPSP